MKKLVVFILILILIGCAPKMDSQKQAALLLETDKKFAETSIEIGAAKAFKQFLTDDAIQLPSDRMPISGKGSIFEQMSKSGDAYTLQWQPQHAEVAESCDLGWTWGFYSLISNDTKEVLDEGKYLNVWKRIDGNWLVAVDMGNSNGNK